jgi:hypothetical protein
MTRKGEKSSQRWGRGNIRNGGESGADEHKTPVGRGSSLGCY